MKHSFCSTVRGALAESLTEILNIPVSPEQIRLPARGAAVGCAAAIAEGADAEEWAMLLNDNRSAFFPVLGVLPVKRVRAENGWLLFDLSDELYSAAAVDAAEGCGDIPSDHENYLLHRLRMLARYPSHGCPADAQVQRALLLCFAADEQPTAANLKRAEDALLTMAYALSPRDRTLLLSACGDVARAAVRLLYAADFRGML